MVLAGALKMRLGPLRARLVTHIGSARAILNAVSPAEKELRVIKEKLQKACESLDKLNSEWINLIEDQTEENKPRWEQDYRAHAEGDNSTQNCLIEESVRIWTLEH